MIFRSVSDVVAWRLCVGCGACVAACPEKKVTLIDIQSEGIRPVISGQDCGACDACLKVCPGVAARQQVDANAIVGLSEGWGTVLEVWEGYAADPDVRFSGSSGGLATALALYCIEKGSMGGVLHTGSDADQPLKNKTHLSQTLCQEMC